MSVIAVQQATLGKVNVDIIKKALEVLALEETNLQIRDYIEDYSGKKHTVWEGNKILGSIFSSNLPRGVGVAVNKEGNLLFVSHDRGSWLEKAKAGVERAYKLVALVTALQGMGYDVAVLQETKEMTTLEATSGRRKIMVGLNDTGIITTDYEGFAGKACLEEALKLAEELKALGVNIDVKNLERKEELANDLREIGVNPDIAYNSRCG